MLNQLNFHKREELTYRVKNYLSAYQLKMAYLVINAVKSYSILEVCSKWLRYDFIRAAFKQIYSFLDGVYSDETGTKLKLYIL